MISDSVPAQTPELEPAGGQPALNPAARPPWLIPGVVLVVVLAVAIGLVAGMSLINRSGAGSGAASYVPADAAAYYELRLDLPGDQRPALRSFLGHFPLLQADKFLTDEVDQQLDQLSAAAPSGYRYSTDIKPWFDGRLGFALVKYPSLTAGMTTVPDLLVLVGVKDAAAAGTLNDRVRADLTKAGVTVTSSSHGGVTIWSAKGGSTETTPGTPQEFAWAITADQLVGGTSVDLVSQALDSHSGAAPSLASRSEYSAGLARLPADRVFTLSVNLKTVLARLQQDTASAQPSAACAVSQLMEQAPTYSLVSGRFESDRFVVDSTSTTSATLPTNTDRGLAALVPGDAIYFADSANFGKSLAAGIDYLKTCGVAGSAVNPSLDQIRAALGGDIGSYVSWMGDTAIVAGDTDSTPWVGLISKPTDVATARSKLVQLQALLQLASKTGGPRVDVSTSDHNGTQITTIQFEDSSGWTPVWASSVQYAVTDQRVVIGTGATFVARVLDMQSSGSLASNARFNAALDSVGGTPNTGTFWLDLTALRTALEPLVPAESQAMYQTSIRPWVAPFDYLVGSGKVAGQQVDGHFAVVVK